MLLTDKLMLSLATHQQTERWVLVKVMEIGNQRKVANPAPLHHPGDGFPDPLGVALDAEEVKGDVQAIGGVGNQFQIADFCDVEVPQHATQLKWKNSWNVYHFIILRENPFGTAPQKSACAHHIILYGPSTFCFVSKPTRPAHFFIIWN